MASVWGELKRRNVVRVAVAYAIVSWLILQLTDVLMPLLSLPQWVGGLVFLLLVIGFLLALILSWAYELTPEGVKLEKHVDRSQSITHITGRKLDFIIIGVLMIALLMFTLDKFVWTTDVAPVDTANTQQRTIAVLSFINMSSDPEQEYFSDGLAEQLINLLAQIPELRVTSRTSAFSFKGKDATIAEVGRTLDVEHVLEGSVRRSGDTIRITAQLINVSTDTHVWSNTWDRSFADVFVIQDEIAESVVGALKVQLFGDVPRVIETTPEAYALYLQSAFLIEQGTPSSYRQAEAINKRILEIDPEYAPAWAQRAFLYFHGPSYGAWEPVDAIPHARDAAKKSLRLFENNAWPHAILAQIAIDYDYDYELAARELETALELGPEDPIVLRVASRFAQNQGNLEDAIRYLEKAHTVDPLAGHRTFASMAYFYSGRQAEGISLFEEAIRRRPFAEFVYKLLALALLQMGDVDGALAAIDKENVDGHRISGLALIYEAIGDRERSTEELEKLRTVGNRWTFEFTEAHAYRGELDEAFEWIDRAIERRDPGLRHVMYSPFLDNMREDPRFDDVLLRLGLKPGP